MCAYCILNYLLKKNEKKKTLKKEFFHYLLVKIKNLYIDGMIITLYEKFVKGKIIKLIIPLFK